MEQRPNIIYALLYGLGRSEPTSLELRLVDLFAELTERGSLEDRNAPGGVRLHWTDIAMPLALYMREVGGQS